MVPGWIWMLTLSGEISGREAGLRGDELPKEAIAAILPDLTSAYYSAMLCLNALRNHIRSVLCN